MSSITRLAFILGAAVGALAAPATAGVPSIAGSAADSRVVPGKWIVSLKPDIAPQERVNHFGWVDTVHRRSLSRRQSAGVEKTFDIGSFHGYVGEFDEDLIAEISAADEVRRNFFSLLHFLLGNLHSHVVTGRRDRAGPRSRPHCTHRAARPAVGPGEHLVEGAAGEHGPG